MPPSLLSLHGNTQTVPEYARWTKRNVQHLRGGDLSIQPTQDIFPPPPRFTWAYSTNAMPLRKKVTDDTLTNTQPSCTQHSAQHLTWGVGGAFAAVCSLWQTVNSRTLPYFKRKTVVGDKARNINYEAIRYNIFQFLTGLRIPSCCKWLDGA